MSAIFQRPMCDLGTAYDFSFRPVVGDPDPSSGGGCDERPHRVELFGATADPASKEAPWRSFRLCPEHESQLRGYDDRVKGKGAASRFRTPAPSDGRR
jgi:hypothetical protein